MSQQANVVTLAAEKRARINAYLDSLDCTAHTLVAFSVLASQPHRVPAGCPVKDWTALKRAIQLRSAVAPPRGFGHSGI